MKNILVLFSILLTSAIWSCGGQTPTPTPLPGATCADACAAWARLRCLEAEPTPDGTTCISWCSTAAEIPAFAARLGCYAVVKTCDGNRTCELPANPF